MTSFRLVPGAAVALALLVGLAALSRVPYATGDASRALLRLSWRARGERIERCRRATAAELAEVPAHMRREVICEGAHVAPYRLDVVVDDRTLQSGIVTGSDVRGDRPIFLLREFELAPGRHRFEVRFTKVSTADSDSSDRPGGGAAAPARERESPRTAVPPLLALDTTMVVAAGSVVLVTYNSEGRRLEIVRGRSSTADRSSRR